ncbi:MAG: S8 family peptidase [Pseudomonadota bacterium]
MTKAVLKSGVAIVALSMSHTGLAFAQGGHDDAALAKYEGILYTNYGSLDAFYGSLDAFWGSLDAFYGSLDAFDGGRLNPHYGNLDAFGDLNAQYGSLDAFYGSLDAFYGNLDAFYEHLDAHWGSLDAFYGNLDAFYGSLDAFWGSLDAFYGSLDAFYGSLDAFETPDTLKKDIRALVKQSREAFGDAVKAETGQSIDKAIFRPLMKKYGLKPNLSNFHELKPQDAALMVIELNDTLMLFTGLDHVDHWMGAIGWSPSLSYEVGAGEGVRIGIIDTLISEAAEENFNQITTAKGFRAENQQHGAAVAALINANHDGYGVMGVAPEAALSFYNPFDETLTTNWQDVTRAVTKAARESRGNADVINLSLGTPGWTLHQDWTQVFANNVIRRKASDVVFVKAAGNSGVAQSEDIEWGKIDAHNRLLIVGSVNPSGEISAFSNRPGDACLLTKGVCEPENLLMNRFLVAPGELLLSSDNAGGVTRVTGTSFAAPLVTGAVALVQGNWPWLKSHPEETADIILQSATDLGDPGVDSTYGWGLLNVDAALEPLDPNNLTVQTANGTVSYASLGGTTNGVISLAGSGVSLTFIETIGETYRDFTVELDGTSLEGDPEAVQDTETEAYLSSRASGTTLSLSQTVSDSQFLGFTDGLYVGGGTFGDEKSRWLLSIEANRHAPDQVLDIDAVPFQTTSTLVNNETGLTLRFGQGESALNFSGNGTFGMLSDHDVQTGGVNPLLGLASGGTFASALIPVDNRLVVGVGITATTERQGFIDAASGEFRASFADVADYQASAINFHARYLLSDRVDLTTSYTQLHETTGLLGTQGAGAFALEGGATTDAVSLGADAFLHPSLTLSASATFGRTQGGDFDQSVLSVAEDGLTSTAFQITAEKLGVFGKADRLRASIAQPLHIENGDLAVTSMQVIDRETGELGLVTNHASLDQDARRMVSELLYSRPLADGRGSMSAFSQLDTGDTATTGGEMVVTNGMRFTISF